MIDSKKQEENLYPFNAGRRTARQYAWEVSTEYINRVMEEMGEEKMDAFLALWKELVDIMEKNIGMVSENPS